MAKPLMSDAEIRRRKKLQGTISHATGTLGLTALGARLGAKGPAKLAAKSSKLKRLESFTPERMKDTSNGLATTAAGIGGAGSFNFASYTAAESRKRGMSTVPKKKPVSKSGNVSAFGVAHD